LQFNPDLYRSERDVESKFIVSYLLPKLGYLPNSWYQEVAFGNIRLDFLAFAIQVLPFSFDGSNPLSLVIEAKSPKSKLDSHIPQLKKYLTSLRVDYGILTNGKELRVYERTGKNIQATLQLKEQDVYDRIEEVKLLVGRSSLKSKELRTKVEDKNQNRSFQDMKVIAVYHNKGGVGKTTVSVNLAAALRNKGYKVLLIDLDSQANSTFATGLVKFQFEEDDNLRDNNVFHVLETGDFNFIPDVARQSDYFNDPEFSIIPSHISLIEGQYKLNQVKASQTRLIKKLKREEKKYDFVIIDTPPSRDIYAQVAIISANYLIIPSDLKPFANQGLVSVQSFIKEIDEFRDSLGRSPIKLMGILPSKISTNAKFLANTFPRQQESIMNHYCLPLMDTIIYERAALSHCLNQTLLVGDLEVPDPKSIFEYANSNAAAAQSASEFEALAEEVLKKVS